MRRGERKRERFRGEIELSICVSLFADVFHPSFAGLKHLDAGCEAPTGSMNPPEVPKTSESAAGRWVRVFGGGGHGY